jgi:UDP-N-acetylmuramoyl-tripeptide--D-alanyl-D-alanine ligase
MKAAVDVLSTLAKPCLLVIGDMGEVGNQGPQFHEELGHYAQLKQIDLMYCTGEASLATTKAFNKNATQGKHFSNKEQLHDAVNAALKDVNSILVKGSRFMKMESVIEAIYQHISIEDSHHAV